MLEKRWVLIKPPEAGPGDHQISHTGSPNRFQFGDGGFRLDRWAPIKAIMKNKWTGVAVAERLRGIPSPSVNQHHVGAVRNDTLNIRQRAVEAVKPRIPLPQVLIDLNSIAC